MSFRLKGLFNTDEYDARRVLDRAIDKLETTKGWVIVGVATVAILVLSKYDILDMSEYEQKRVMERLIDMVGDAKQLRNKNTD